MKNILRRTMLFIPGNNPGMIQNAGILGSDTIILDLEDAVSVSEKDSARLLVKEALRNVDFYDTEMLVRINPLSSGFGLEDVNIIARMKPDAILVPKATENDIVEIDKILTKIESEEGFPNCDIKIVALIESAYGLENIHSIIESSPRINGVLLGGEDLTADLGIVRTKDGNEISYARSKVATACRVHKISSIDTPFSDVNDMEGLKKDTYVCKSVGFTGKAAINPRQIDIIHEVLSPSEREINDSKKIIKAAEEAEIKGLGVFSLDGKMIDAPIITRAKDLLEKARRAGLL